MAKRSYILLLIAALLMAALVGFLILYMSPCGVTIEKFQDAPAEPAPEPAPAPAPMPAPMPVPAPAQPSFQAMKSKMPKPVPVPTSEPVAPTPASSAAALSLTPVQCSALCPVTQESCESKFSCQTKLEPIGVAPMTTNSTPALTI